jgi:hypothetical protein
MDRRLREELLRQFHIRHAAHPGPHDSTPPPADEVPLIVFTIPETGTIDAQVRSLRWCVPNAVLIAVCVDDSQIEAFAQADVDVVVEPPDDPTRFFTEPFGCD